MKTNRKNRNKTEKPLKMLYQGVKLPVFRTLLGSLLYVVGTHSCV